MKRTLLPNEELEQVVSDDCQVTNTDSQTLTAAGTAEKRLSSTFENSNENPVTAGSLAVARAFTARETSFHSDVSENSTSTIDNTSLERIKEKGHPSLSESVEASVSSYLAATSGQNVNGLYELVLSEIEAPLLAVLMKHTGRNQSLASEMLGLNRGTLRKKLKKYGLI